MNPIRILTPSLLAVALVSCVSPQANRFGDPNAPGSPGTAQAAPWVTAPAPPATGTLAATGVSPAAPVAAEPSLAATPAPPAAPVVGTTTIHTVVKGDTLWGIGKQYKIPVQSIKQANRMTTDTVVLGSKLVIPPQ